VKTSTALIFPGKPAALTPPALIGQVSDRLMTSPWSGEISEVTGRPATRSGVIRAVNLSPAMLSGSGAF
jgi:hypothetical protein